MMPHVSRAHSGAYLRIIFGKVTIVSIITKNGTSLVPRVEMPVPKMATVTFKLLYFQVE